VGDTSVSTLAGYNGVFVVAGTRNIVATAIRAYPGNSDSVALNIVIEIEFDRALDPATVITDSVSLHVVSDGGPVPCSVNLRGDRIIRLRPLMTLAPHTMYFYEVSARVRDVTGNAAREVRRSFRTSEDFDGTVATVRESLPHEGSVGVGTDSSIIIRFDKAVNPISVAPDTIRLTGDERGWLPASISFEDDFREVILTPLGPMPANARITVTASGVEDSSGHVISPRITEFTTGRTRSAADAPAVRR
jgi:hypothetical protein